jgi:alkaline phosphatase D
MTTPSSPSRRRFLGGALAAGGALVTSGAWPRSLRAQTGPPGVPFGVQTGEVTADRAVLWSATDRPARLLVEYAATERFQNVQRVVGPAALPESGYAAKVVLAGLPAGQDVFYRVTFLDLGDMKTASAPVVGRFRTAPADGRDVSFVWSGDTAGQGWGINPEWGGMRLYEVMRGLEPDFFVHCGDMIYADGPLKAEVELPGGAKWKNVVIEEKSKVAETLEEFRGNYRYNLMDEHVRRFNAQVPQYVQWDDHEVTNNWFHERVIEDSRYTVRSAGLLAARAKRAMFEFTPLAVHPVESERVYRRIGRGPSLDLFMIDMRSYRGPNGENRETTLGDASRILGREQSTWLKQELLASRATWKVISADMPLGLVVYHDFGKKWGSEAVAQATAPRWAGSSRSPTCSASSSTTTSGTSCGSRPTSTTAPRIGTSPAARSSPTSSRSTSSSRGRSTPGASVRTSSTTPSGRRSSSRSTRAAAPTRPRARAGSTSATFGSTARAGS